MEIISGRYVITMDPERRILDNAGVAVSGDEILAIDSIGNIREKYPDASEVGGKDFVVLPGLVNTHMHLSCSLFRGYIDDLPLIEHDERFLFPGQRAMTPDDVYHASLLSSVELLKNGITTVADGYLLPEATAKAMHDSGMRGIVSPAMMDVWLGGDVRPVIKSTSAAIEELQKLHANWDGADNGRITVWPYPFTDLSASPELMRESARLARDWDAGIQIHLAETFEGVNLVKRTYGKRVLEFVESTGLLDGTRVIAAHCCWLSEPDIAIMKAHNLSVSYCPSAEMKMADGVTPVARLIHDNVCVSVAIDATCVNNSADLFREAKLGVILQKVVYPLDSEILPGEQGLEMITCEAARALGMESVIGSLEVGKKADIITLRIDHPHFVPLIDRPRPTIINHLIYAATGADVSDVYVGGRRVVSQGRIETVSEDDVVRSAQEVIYKFIERSGISKEITPLRWLSRSRSGLFRDDRGARSVSG